MSLSDVLDALIKSQPAEIIDGNNVREIAEKFVDIDIAYSPVVQHAIQDPATNYLGHVPTPVSVTKEGNRYAIVDPRNHDFAWVSEATVKEMRARYLLLRGFYSRVMNGLPHPQRQEVLAKYFPDGWLDVEALLKGGNTTAAGG